MESAPCELFKNAHVCALRDCLGVSRPFVSDTSPKCIDREGLKRRRTGTSQIITIIIIFIIIAIITITIVIIVTTITIKKLTNLPLVFAVSAAFYEFHCHARSGETARELERVVNRSCDVSQCVSSLPLATYCVTDSSSACHADCFVTLETFPPQPENFKLNTLTL